ncbi:hypothetical protein IQ07DRAFT_569617 [Pyrenochaeta sp. DS3sAY3a]|nr:hypothetical protein IQ07DRAFT_569617 [Pyrenochaeta sp. DS3sAY3a]
MDYSRTSSTPPATARPKNPPPPSPMSSAHAASGSQQAPAMAASRTARGSTPTASRSAAKLVDADKPARPTSRDSLKQKMLKKPDDAHRPCKSEEQLKALKSDFDALRSHVTCKICDRLLYQPYTISCGHTYCYTCLCTWFVSNKARKTCPDCRILVKEPPAPAYVIRDMTAVFTARAELLPPGETLDDHQKWLKDEADAVQQDKDNKDPRTGGLFKGCFRVHPLHGRGPSLQVVRDQEDGVDRCPICTWELEDGGCQQCGLIFDHTGEVSWGDSFTGFSDMDDMSEHDTDELDTEMEMDDVDYEAYEEWGEDIMNQGSFMMRRFLEAGMAPNVANFARRRPMTHSEAGSRRSYSQSIVSDMYGDEMDTVEEEDEDGLDEEDSEMNDFIDDEDIEASTSASAASSTPGPTPRQLGGNRARAQGRARRVVESETSSTISSVIEEEDEDEEDAGPIRRGQRNTAQTRALNRANGSRSSHGPPSSTSTDVSTGELDEDTQALLREEGWMLQRDDDEMGEEDEDDSDTGTTVGWEPLANHSNDRNRMAGSLTPTADRPRPSAPIRPPSRTGNMRVLNASRGLRRRSSVLSTSTVHYEDGEADDDDSDQDGDLELAMNTLRTRRSQAQMRTAGAFMNPNGRVSTQLSQNIPGNDLDTDDNSDNSQPGSRQRGSRPNRSAYNPRISWMFAEHQQALQQHHMTNALIDIEPLSTTPLARPRTRNRNRPSPAQAFSPFLPPPRLRTPHMDGASNNGPASRMPVSPPRRSTLSPALPPQAIATNTSRYERAPSIASSTSNASTILTPGTSAASSQLSIDSIAQTQAAAAMDMIDRPQSRVSARPSSAAGRRNSSGFSPANPAFPHSNLGLHNQGSVLPPFQARGNPWAAFVQARGIRNRSSRQVLREQSSTATLRPTSSRANIRESSAPQQNVRTQTSRINLRSQPSRRQLNNQASTRTLRASEYAQPPPSPGQNVQSATQPTARPIRLSADERDSRARELIEARRRALGQPGNPPARTNPFTQGFQRPVNPAGPPTTAHPPSISQHVRSNSNESMQSVNSSGTAQGAPTSPVLGRRRSRPTLNAPPSGIVPPSQTAFASPVTAYTNNYFRPRQGSIGAYEAPVNVNNRGMSPMMAGQLI